MRCRSSEIKAALVAYLHPVFCHDFAVAFHLFTGVNTSAPDRRSRNYHSVLLMQVLAQLAFAIEYCSYLALFQRSAKRW